MKCVPWQCPHQDCYLKKSNCTQFCPITKILKVVWSKWAIPILVNLKNKKRFWELKKGLSDISEKMLIQNLRILENKKFIKRKIISEKPLHVEYSLLKRWKKFLTILPVIIEIWEWL